MLFLGSRLPKTWVLFSPCFMWTRHFSLQFNETKTVLRLHFKSHVKPTEKDSLDSTVPLISSEHVCIFLFVVFVFLSLLLLSLVRCWHRWI